jgi:hypothetical protein
MAGSQCCCRLSLARSVDIGPKKPCRRMRVSSFTIVQRVVRSLNRRLAIAASFAVTDRWRARRNSWMRVAAHKLSKR